MKRSMMSAAILSLVLSADGFAQQAENYDYWAPQRAMVQRGQQAVFMCNGLFTSQRTLEQVFSQELAFLRAPIGTVLGGDYHIDYELSLIHI